ncbi:hypothetical protein DFQ28_007579 [Apophysomyces sp. BC1034]|nr:hypothetical protein DFQ30_003164 [Apophysomyces sp. BC1015]KAG0182162.1 hypothetical protein DFQ29_005522 [Apophysomyces sp. BC1021]KAG0192819.1 hypothetical protein DFQ28_007579 [Apophysomyces sp. BC1034]
MSRPRSYSTRTSPQGSPSYRPNPTAERREQRRAVTTNIGGSRGSILLSEIQLSKVNYTKKDVLSKMILKRHYCEHQINKKIAKFESGSGASSISSQISADYPDLTDIDYALPLSHNEQSKRSSFMTIPNSGTFKEDHPVMNPNSPSLNTAPSTTTQSIGNFPVRIQEYAVIEDLLHVLMGFNGVYIQFLYPKIVHDEDDQMEDGLTDTSPQNEYWNAVQYIIDPTLDPSLKHLVENLLPLSKYFVSVDAFIEQFSRFEYGTINHALCASIREFLKGYLTFIAQLEHQFQTSSSFTLQRFWFYAQDTLGQMKVLHNLAMAIRRLSKETSNAVDEFEAVLEELKAGDDEQEIRISEWQKGGAILNILAERLIGLSGDPQCRKIYSFLLARASVPYFNILQLWIYHGEIKDTYNEFMIEEKRNVKKENLKEDFNDAYWEMRYTIRDNMPSFLEPLQKQILLAGKYLNVVQECGVNIAKPGDMLDAMREDNITKDILLETPVVDDDFRNRENRLSSTRRGIESSAASMTLEQSHVSSRNEVWAAVDGGRFVKSLEIAYKYANHTLLNLLLKEQKLIERLRSLKHYFFLDQSDFLTSFLDLAKEELGQPAKQVSLTRLQSLMDLVLRNPSSVAAYDPYKEGVTVAMSPFKLIDQLLRIINVAGLNSTTAHSRDPSWMNIGGLGDSTPTPGNQGLTGSVAGSVAGSVSGSTTGSGSREFLTGYDALTLDYTVTFPLSLVISRKALTKYQLLFRHLLYLKHVEELLCATWIGQKDPTWRRQSLNPDIEKWKFQVFSLRSRMLGFVQQFAYYVTNEVLEPNWRRMEADLSRVSTVDQVLQYHSDFLDTCLKECMLTNAKLLRVYNKLMNSCVIFVSHAERYAHLLRTFEEQTTPGVFNIPKNDPDAATVASIENASRTLTKIDGTFLYHMKLLIEALNHYSATETVQFLCLVVRLDYNQYYNDSITKDRNRRQQQ